MIGAVLGAVFQGALLVLQAGLADLDATSAGGAPVWAAKYLTPNGEVDDLPLYGSICIKDNTGADVVMLAGRGDNNSYVRKFVKFIDRKPTAIRMDASWDGKNFEKVLALDYRDRKYQYSRFAAYLVVPAIMIYSDVCQG
ncbi:MAG: hypothetical protein KDJ88_13540 [Bauldia sp.]|nr:hypothetical protein [Bauldia sp.]